MVKLPPDELHSEALTRFKLGGQLTVAAYGIGAVPHVARAITRRTYRPDRR
jgi:hypothetical protein